MMIIWLAFIIVILVLLALDLGVFHRRQRNISPQEALAWTGFWISLALMFNVLIYFMYEGHWLGAGIIDSTTLSGKEAALQFLTGYVIEKSLSLDNVFVIALIFVHFSIPLKFQHKVLFWGIIGALVFRAIMILAGSYLLQHFSWMTYVFGLLLMYSAVRLLVAHHDNLQIEKNYLVKLIKRFIPVVNDVESGKFFVRLNNRWAATPLFIVLIVVEGTDLLFAIDSIPAIFAVTKDPFIVFSANVFAILGLRSLYFALAGLMDKFRYLKNSLVFVVAFVGVSMLLTHHLYVSSIVSLSIIAGILTVGILASLRASTRDTTPLKSPIMDEFEEVATLSYRMLKKIIVVLAGSSLLLIGALLLILPGPGILIILIGLTILGSQFLWARNLLLKIKNKSKEIEADVRKTVKDVRNKLR